MTYFDFSFPDVQFQLQLPFFERQAQRREATPEPQKAENMSWFQSQINQLHTLYISMYL